MPQREGHGFWPYLLPYVGFLLILEIGGRLPEGAAGPVLFVQVALPLGLVLYFVGCGSYPELRGFRATPGGVLLDVGVGLIGAIVWVAPFLALDSLCPGAPEASGVPDFLRPDAEGGFDPNLMGPSLVGLALMLRGLGYGLATPFVEELFVRSWLLRYAEVVFEGRRDFRDVPIAHFTWPSFAIVTMWFVLSHVTWEWGVMFGWTILTMLWFYHRRHIVPLVIVHAVTNLSILLFVVLADEKLLDAQGQPISLWFFL